jgi:hypothetical protein
VDEFSGTVWIQVAAFLSARARSRAVFQGGQLYIVRYDAVADTWAVVGLLGQGRDYSGVAIDESGGGIFVVGGYRAGSYFTVVERFSTRSLRLSVLSPLPQGRRSPAVLVQSGVLHVLGGWGPAGGSASRFSLALGPAAVDVTGWTETADALQTTLFLPPYQACSLLGPGPRPETYPTAVACRYSNQSGRKRHTKNVQTLH